jgi:nucleotide-binding universal stress UspA family protein
MSTPTAPTNPTTPSAGRIVVGVDGSGSSIDALLWAARIAVGIGAEVDALISWNYPTGYGIAGVATGWDPAADATAVLAEALAKAFGDAVPTGLRSLVREGYAPAVLLEAGHDAQMLVVGSRGHGGFVGLLLGSVSSHCAEHATCPVLVVH